MQKKPLNKWSQVAQAMSNLNQNKSIKALQTMRKNSYRNALQKQIIEHNQSFKADILNKQVQRQNVIKQSLNQSKIQMQKKLKKIKIQQFYQLQNLDLVENHKKSKESLESDKKISESFIKLAEIETQRKDKTKKNFQLQNLLNNKQIQIKNKSLFKQKQLQKYEKQMYNSFIQNEYQKRKIERELWRKKYLDQKQIKETDNKNYKSSYQMFLKKQIEEKRSKTRNQKQRIDDKLRNINLQIQKIDSSPAYFGIRQAQDRRRQISLIDRHLNLNPSQQPPIIRNSHNDLQKGYLANSNSHLLRQSKTNEDIRINYKAQDRLSLQNYQLKNQSQPKITKQFKRYDFITGTHKNFFI